MQRTPSGRTERTCCSSASLPLRSSSVSSSYALSKWSSMARLCRPVTKIMSVMPAAAASSTAYWMSGLSTTGIISLGLALVTGRKRLPNPATGNTAFLSLAISTPQNFAQLRLVDHRHTEAPGALELGSGLGAGHHVIGLLRHRCRDLVPAGLERLACFFARHALERPGKHEGLAAFPATPCRGAHFDGLRQAVDHLTVVRLVHELVDRLRELRADAFQWHLAHRLAALAPLGIVLAHRLLVRHQGGPVGLQE